MTYFINIFNFNKLVIINALNAVIQQRIVLNVVILAENYLQFLIVIADLLFSILEQKKFVDFARILAKHVLVLLLIVPLVFLEKEEIKQLVNARMTTILPLPTV